MSKRISQQTFDEAVAENMATFGQSREEAVADAVAEFESAGVDLSNIVTSADANTHPVLKALGVLKGAVEPLIPRAADSSAEQGGVVDLTSTSASSTTAVDASPAGAFLDAANEEAIKPVRDALNALEEEVGKDAASTRSVAGSNNAIKWLTVMVGALVGDLPTAGAALASIGDDGLPGYVHHSLLLPSLRVLRHLCAESAENRALVGVGFASVLLRIMTTKAAAASSSTSANAETEDAVVRLRAQAMHLAALLCVKREGYKVALFTRGLPAAVATVLDEAAATMTAADPAAAPSAATREQQSSLVTAACSVLSRVLQDDDLSIEASKVYSFARAIAVTAPENTPASGTTRTHSSAALALGVLPDSPLLPSGLAGKMLATFVAFESDPVVASEALAALKALTVNEDVCKEIDAKGGVAAITRALARQLAFPYVPTTSKQHQQGTGDAAAAPAAKKSRKPLEPVAEGGEGGEGADQDPGDDDEGQDDEPTATPAVAAAEPASSSSSSASTTSSTSAAPVDPAAAAASARRGRMLRGGLAVLRALAGSDTVKKRMCDPELPLYHGGVDTLRKEFAAAAAATAGASSAGAGSAGGVVEEGLLEDLEGSGGAGSRTLALSAARSPLHLSLAAIRIFSSASSFAGDLAAAGSIEQALHTIGNLCLRLSEHADLVVAEGGMALIARAMRVHPAAQGVQRASCLAIRNIVVRSKERAAAAFDAGLEALLKAAYARHPFCRDVVYAALRDMGCDYAETTRGQAQAARAMRAIAAGDISVK